MADFVDHEDSLSEDEDSKEGGYRHFNDSNDTSFAISLFDLSLDLIQLPNASTELALGHGAVVWEAAVIFCKYLEYGQAIKELSSMDKLAGKRVLELGSGTGLAGMALMLKGCKVTFTDLQPVVEHITVPNVNKVYKHCMSNGNTTNGGVTMYEPVVYPIDWTGTDTPSLPLPTPYM